MKLFKTLKPAQNASDADLVMASLGGDCDSFGLIVSRYQSLLCSLAYSAVGDIKHSEDIAQEAFIEAWRKLDSLRDPEKLKAWLCGILRFRVSRYLRKESTQPLHAAAELDEHGAYVSDQPGLEDAAIQQQERVLLWQTLEQLPPTYREPLVLFYREHRSVEHVASELELTEATVKQRLSRGRKMLQEAMVTFVEDTLEKSKPGVAFTSAVLVAITSLSPPTKAAVFGTGVLKTGYFFKWTGLLALLASFSGVIGSFFSVRAGLDQSRTQRERRAVIKTVVEYFFYAIVYIVGMLALRYLAQSHSAYHGVAAVAAQLLALAFVGVYILLLVRMLISQPRMRAQERLAHPEAFQADRDRIDSPQREYKTKLTLLGAPLVHFKLGAPEPGDRPAFGWIAGGDRAFGLLFAWGGFAVAPVSVGIVSAGLLSIGAVSLGLLSLATVAIGFIGLGASAIAYKGYASFSVLGWESAVSGGFSIAREAAIGPFAFAHQINNEAAAAMANLTTLDQTYLWLLGTIAVLVIVPAIWHSNVVRRRMGRKRQWS